MIGLCFGDAVRICAARHSSLFSFRRPQCVSLREVSNSWTWPRLNACMMPIRANLILDKAKHFGMRLGPVGPPAGSILGDGHRKI